MSANFCACTEVIPQMTQIKQINNFFIFVRFLNVTIS
jgi:hypothetical protein